MASRVRVISNRFDEIERNVVDAVEDEMIVEIAEDVANGAERRSRRRTGFLASSWQAELDEPGKAVAYSDAATAHIHEFGAAGANISAQPMAVPAAEEVRSSMGRESAKTVKRAAR